MPITINSGGWEPGLIENQYDIYQWTTRNTNTCPLCQAMSGRTYMLDVYITSTIYPGFHKHCDCYLKKMPAGTKQSDLDIFGSSLNLRNDGWMEMLFGNWENLWWSGNVTLTREVMGVSEPGMTAGQALAALRSKSRSGIFSDYTDIFGEPSWSVFRTASPDLYQSFNQILTSLAGTMPKPAPVKPQLPTQTYHYPNYSLSQLGLY
jgi:hypothetical protein